MIIRSKRPVWMSRVPVDLGALLWLSALPFTVAFGSLTAIHIHQVAATPADALVWFGALVLVFDAWRSRGRPTVPIHQSLVADNQPWGDGDRSVDNRLPIRSATAPRALPVGIKPLIGAFLALIVWMLCSLLWAPDRVLALKEVVKWSEALLVFWIATRLITSARHVRVALSACAVVAALEAMIGAAQGTILAGDMAVAADRGVRVLGTFGQPNPYAGYLNLTLPILVALLVIPWLGWRALDPSTAQDTPAAQAWQGIVGDQVPQSTFRLWGGYHWQLVLPLLLALLGALWLADSRGAILGFLVAQIAMAYCAWPRARRWFAIAAGAITLLGGAALALAGHAIARKLDAAGWRGLDNADLSRNITDANYSAIDRLAHWTAALRMFVAHPWTGVGAGNYASRYLAYNVPRWTHALGHAHNIYLNTAAELGIPGLLAYLVFVALTLVWCWRAAALTTGIGRALAIGSLGVAVALVIHQAFDDMTTHDMLLQFALILGWTGSLPLIWPARRRSICIGKN